jgi:hypothetical protein
MTEFYGVMETRKTDGHLSNVMAVTRKAKRKPKTGRRIIGNTTGKIRWFDSQTEAQAYYNKLAAQ